MLDRPNTLSYHVYHALDVFQTIYGNYNGFLSLSELSSDLEIALKSLARGHFERFSSYFN